jgi:hypothetical protein
MKFEILLNEDVFIFFFLIVLLTRTTFFRIRIRILAHKSFGQTFYNTQFSA